MIQQQQLTQQQDDTLKYIKEKILKKGYPPTVREIGKALGVKSTSSIYYNLEALQEKGYIRRDSTKPRAIEIIDDCFNLIRREVVNVPVLDTISSGQPLYSERNIKDYYPIPLDMLPNKREVFMLLVKDDSMIKASIYKDDKVVVKVTDRVEDGDIVVALIDDLPLIRRFFKEDDRYRLQPENDVTSSIIVNQVEIVGKVIGVFRLGIH